MGWRDILETLRPAEAPPSGLSPDDWSAVLRGCGVRNSTALTWAVVFAEEVRVDVFSAGAADMVPFVGQALHETAMLETLEENLRYSAQRLAQVWPRRFSDSAVAARYAYNAQALGDAVYGGRLGNREPGDGFRFRGRGIPQITGRDNYEAMQKLTGLPLLERPDLLLEPRTALRVGVAWWESNIADHMLGSNLDITRRLNGGTTGLAERERLTERVRGLLAPMLK